MRGIVTGAVAGVAALAVHGLVDFNLRIPSNAIMFVALMAFTMAPLGSLAWRTPRRWAFVAAVAAVAVTYLSLATPWPSLGEARASAVKAQEAQQKEGRSARLWIANRNVRAYLGRRPADPEAWLLAAWTTSAIGDGDRKDAAALARYAVTLDPQSPDAQEAMRALVAALPAADAAEAGP